MAKLGGGIYGQEDNRTNRNINNCYCIGSDSGRSDDGNGQR